MPPYFLVGAERSGTTLLRLMLDAHPSIAWLNEFEYAVDLATSADSWPDIELYWEWLSVHRVFISTAFKIDKSLDYPNLIESFLLQKKMGKPIIGATCHRHYDRLLRLFPKAKFIYLYRDPRDVARSNIGMGWAGNAWAGVDRWIEAERLWETVKSNSLDESSYIEVKYENLIKHPEQTLTAICQFFHVGYNAKMLSYPEYTTYSYPDARLIEQWKNKATNEEIALVECKARIFMGYRDYQVESAASYYPSLSFRLYLFLQNKFYRLRYRIKQYGFELALKEMITRRLKLRNYRRGILLKMNAINQKKLK